LINLGDIYMKKSLLVLAMMGAFAGFAYAQSSVTVYGIVDVGIAYDSDRTSVGNTTRIDSGNQSGSRLGFRGTEDLGGGLSAHFVLENGFAVDTGAATQGGLLFGRQAKLGLKGGFGEVNVGRLNTLTFDANGAVDPFGTGFGGASTNMFSANGFRTDNTVRYTTPVMGGFSGDVAYTFGEVAGDSEASSQIGLGLGYTGGPVAVRFVHHEAENATATNTTKTSFLGGVYNLGVLKLHAAYGVNKDDAVLDTRDMLVGVSVPFGASNVMASYIRKEDKQTAQADANQISVGYTYDLSKRTNLYAAYTRTDNDALATYNAAANGLTGSLTQLGIRHKF
jgi:predicted porin